MAASRRLRVAAPGAATLQFRVRRVATVGLECYRRTRWSGVRRLSGSDHAIKAAPYLGSTSTSLADPGRIRRRPSAPCQVSE